MKRLAVQLFAVVFAVWFSASASAAGPDAVITGTGDAAIDLPAVQQAVGRGGDVLLKGVFDFGPRGRVEISRDVNIFGETEARGGPATIIRGGFWTFHSPLPARLAPTAPGPRVVIENIHFQGALWAPVSLPFCSGARIKNNRITNVRPMDTGAPFYGKEGILRQQGIIFVPMYAMAEEKRRYRPGAVTGTIVVSGNHIDLSNERPEQTLGQGVLILWTTGADIRILGNHVVNASRNGLESLDNYPGDDGRGRVLIQGNTVVTPEKGVALPTPATPNGIVAGWFLDPAGAQDPARLCRIVVAGNRIEVRGETSLGIVVISDGAAIASNHIVLKGGEKSKGIIHTCSKGVIAGNRFEGAGQFAVMLVPHKGRAAGGNTLVGNDFTRFAAAAANVLVKSGDNILLGHGGKVVDAGTANLVLDP